MANIRFYDKDLWKLKTVIPSSQHPSFPAANTKDRWPQKPWRSLYGVGNGWGNFEITPDNNLLYFTESADWIIVDPGLEAWTTPTNLTNWAEYVDPSCALTQEAVDKHSGNWSCKLTSAMTPGQYSFISQNITLAAAVNYRITIWYRNDVPETNLFLYLYDTTYSKSLISTGLWQAGVAYITLPYSATWTSYSIDFVKDPGFVNYILAALSTMMNGSCFVDDFNLYPVIGHTATITPGYYNSDNLAVEIETQLEAEGSYDYSVYYDDTALKFVIEQVGGSLFELLYSEQIDAIWDTLGYTAIIDPGYDFIFTANEIRIHTYETLTISNADNEAIYGVFILNHNIQTVGDVKFQGSDDTFVTVPVDVSIAFGTNDRMCYIFTTPVYYGDLRVYINDRTNPDGYIEIGRVFVAYERYIEPRWGYGPKHARKWNDNSLLDFSDGGNPSSIIRYKGYSRAYDFDCVTQVIMDKLMEAFESIGETIPCIILTKPFTGDYSWASPEDNFIYARLAGYAPKRLAGDKWEIKLTVAEEV
jgi:hypothetical protein